MRRLVRVLTARYFWISQSIRTAVRAQGRGLARREGLVEFPGHPAAAGQDEDHEDEDEQKVRHEGQERAERGEEEGPGLADVEALDPLRQAELETRVGHEIVDLLEEGPDHLGVGRQLGGQGLAAGVEDGAHEIEDGEGQDEDDDQGDGLRHLPADQEIEGGRNGEGDEERQGEGDEDRPGQLQEDAEEEEDEDADADPEPLVLVHAPSRASS